ncbi:MAG: hypothetical protein ACI88H_001984 [Cocleimonas sp.]|jgi:hypothetical protein
MPTEWVSETNFFARKNMGVPNEYSSDSEERNGLVTVFIWGQSPRLGMRSKIEIDGKENLKKRSFEESQTRTEHPFFFDLVSISMLRSNMRGGLSCVFCS